MREASLLSALAKAPLPGKFVPQPLQRPSAGMPLELPNAAATVKVSNSSMSEHQACKPSPGISGAI